MDSVYLVIGLIVHLVTRPEDDCGRPESVTTRNRSRNFIAGVCSNSCGDLAYRSNARRNTWKARRSVRMRLSRKKRRVWLRVAAAVLALAALAIGCAPRAARSLAFLYNNIVIKGYRLAPSALGKYMCAADSTHLLGLFGAGD